MVGLCFNLCCKRIFGALCENILERARVKEDYFEVFVSLYSGVVEMVSNRVYRCFGRRVNRYWVECGR